MIEIRHLLKTEDGVDPVPELTYLSDRKYLQLQYRVRTTTQILGPSGDYMRVEDIWSEWKDVEVVEDD